MVLIFPIVTNSAEIPLALTLNDAIRMAVEKNLDVRAELYNPAQFEADINRYHSIYDPVLALQTSYTDSSTATFSSAGKSVNTKAIVLNSSISQLIATGGTAAIVFNNGYSDSTSVTGWQSGLGISLNQPLLKDVGRDATEIAINIARSSKFASLERFNARLLSTVAQVRMEYFKLYSLREDLDVKKVSLELARKILTETQARVRAGVLPAMEVLNAEFGAVTREKDLIDAERAVSDQVDVLRLLLQMNTKVNDILTSDLPSRDRFDAVESEAVQKALNRPDIKEQKRNFEMNELQIKNYCQKLRPDLTFTASAQLTGLDSAYQRNLDKVVTFDYPVWVVGLNLSYPLGNSAAENDYRKSKLKSEQISLQLRSLEETAINEVKSAIRGVVTGYKQIEVADRGRSFAEERLRSFMRKNEVGLATTKDVLDVENDLAVAKSNQIKAVVGYADAMTRYWQVTGELLEREGIRVVEGDADKLYQAIR
jgi:outer membrane protein TolC